MSKFERYTLLMRVLSFLSSLAIVFLIDVSLQPTVRMFAGLRGLLVIAIVSIVVYITLAIGIALYETYNKPSNAVISSEEKHDAEKKSP